MYSILPNQARARWAVIVFYIHIILTLAWALAQWWQAGVIESDNLDMETAEQSDTIVAVASLGFILSFVATIIFFLLWFRRAYANLHRLENSHSILSYSEGWAVGGWFVPFLNLVRPYTIMKEIWNETQSNIPEKLQRDGLVGSSLIGWWWAAWLVYNFLSNLTSRMGGEKEIADIAFGLRAGCMGALCALPAAILAILVIQKINVFEQELYDAQQMSDPMEHFVV